MEKYFLKEKLCSTMGKLNCDVLTITKDVLDDETKHRKKKYVVIMAR